MAGAPAKSRDRLVKVEAAAAVPERRPAEEDETDRLAYFVSRGLRNCPSAAAPAHGSAHRRNPHQGARRDAECRRNVNTDPGVASPEGQNSDAVDTEHDHHRHRGV